MTDYLQLARRGLINWWRFPLTLLVAVLIATLIIIGLAVGLMLFHVRPTDIVVQLERPTNSAFFFSGIAVTFGAYLVGLASAAMLIQSKQPSDIIGPWRWSLFFTGASLSLTLQTLLVLIDLAIAPHGFSLTATAGTVSLAMWAFVGLFVQTFTEEFIFRGYLTQAILLAVKQPIPASIVSGLFFGSLHITNGVPQAINAAIFGIVSSLIAIRFSGVALTFGLHLINNYFGAVFVVSSEDVFRGSPGVFTQNTPQLTWWDLNLSVLTLIGLGWLIFRAKLFRSLSEP